MDIYGSIESAARKLIENQFLQLMQAMAVPGNPEEQAAAKQTAIPAFLMSSFMIESTCEAMCTAYRNFKDTQKAMRAAQAKAKENTQ